MIEAFKEAFKNRTILILPFAGILISLGGSFVYYTFFFSSINMFVLLGLAVYAGILRPEDVLLIIRTLQVISVAALVMIPFLLTFATGKFILRLKRHQSTVNYKTYINAAFLTNFLINERCQKRTLPKNDFLESLGITDYQPDSIDDGLVKTNYPAVEVPDELPEYDANGPSPFKRH